MNVLNLVLRLTIPGFLIIIGSGCEQSKTNETKSIFSVSDMVSNKGAQNPTTTTNAAATPQV